MPLLIVGKESFVYPGLAHRANPDMEGREISYPCQKSRFLSCPNHSITALQTMTISMKRQQEEQVTICHGRYLHHKFTRNKLHKTFKY